jgi:hypothetical protein
MKNSRWRFGLSILLFLLFVIAMKIAIDLPPRHRMSGTVDADRMRGFIADWNSGQSLTLDLLTGKISIEQGGPFPKNYWSGNKAAGWTLFRYQIQKDNQSLVSWELCIDKKENGGEQSSTKIEFPFEPVPLDDKTVVGCSDKTLTVVDLNSNEMKSLSFNLGQIGQANHRGSHTQFGTKSYLQVFFAGNANTQTTFLASLFSIGGDNQPALLWTKPISSEFAVSVIAGSVYLICPTKNSIDQFDFVSGQLIRSTPLTAAMVSRLNASTPAVFTIQNGPVPILTEQTQHTTGSISRFWTIPDFEPLPISEDSSALYGMDDPNDLLYVRYAQENLEEVGKFSFADRKFAWIQKLNRNVTNHSRSMDNKYWCFGVDRGLEFIALDGDDGRIISHWAPFRWIKWSLPAVALGLVVTSLLLLNLAASTKQLRWTVFVLSLVYMVPFLTHLWYWEAHHRVVPCHHYVEGFMVAAMIGSAAWITWGDGRIIKRLVPFFCMLTMLFVLTRLMLSETWMIKEGIGSTLVAGSIAFPLFFTMRFIGFGRQMSTEHSWQQRAWTLPIRDLFLFSTCIAVVVAVVNPLLKSFEVPTGLPSQVELFLIGATALYAVVCWLLFCIVRKWVILSVVTIVVLTALTLLAGLYQLSTSKALFYNIDSLEMAIFRVVTSAAATFYFFARLMFVPLESKATVEVEGGTP